LLEVSQAPRLEEWTVSIISIVSLVCGRIWVTPFCRMGPDLDLSVDLLDRHGRCTKNRVYRFGKPAGDDAAAGDEGMGV
jgi:hypothetical protein